MSASAFAFVFDLQGHRGARGLAPENTLLAFERALAIGVSTLELDCAVTKDGVVVISHDPELNPDITRDDNGGWLAATGPAIAQLTLAELHRYDVGRIKPGSRYEQRFPRQLGADGIRIPRLAELFELVKRSGNDSIRFNIETKISPEAPSQTLEPEAFARAIIAEITRAGLSKRAVIQSFDWRTLKVVQAESPEIATVYLTAQETWLDTIQANRESGSPWTAGITLAQAGSVPKMVKLAGGRIWSPYFGGLTRAQLDEAHTLGLAVIVWTVNERTDIERMIELGVDGLISDYPDMARSVMAARRMPLPPSTPLAPPVTRDP